ncbi:hypothetical protein VTK73DRAFT_7538 [Phialemonium thermophilum]|uniref:MYND-type domain-containing protein n=1 Tax=Phialemonium thermophilum TaxID=223376 RepID=A0ABR3XS29_9PEZI
MPIPDFANPSLFPPLASCPAAPLDPSAAASASAPAHFLLAQITDDMTITKPTLVATDRTGTSFAIVFEAAGAASGPPDRGFLRARGLRKGHTVVVPWARRRVPGSGRREFVAVECGGESGEVGGVRVVPGSLARVLEVGRVMRERRTRRGRTSAEDRGDVGDDEEWELGQEKCDRCGGGEGSSLMQCTGCGEVRYCSKACQVAHWGGEAGHKADCKIMKAIKDIWME